MNTREMATEYRMAQWAQALQERKVNEQSVDAFCGERGISRNTYFYWQRRLREAAARQLAAAAQSEQSQALVPNGWAMATEEIASQPQGLTLRIGGTEIEVHQGYDEALLASVIKTLSQPC